MVEDDIRACERTKGFDETFTKLARSVYFTNDERATVKRQINELLGSTIIEDEVLHHLLGNRSLICHEIVPVAGQVCGMAACPPDNIQHRPRCPINLERRSRRHCTIIDSATGVPEPREKWRTSSFTSKPWRRQNGLPSSPVS